MHTKYFFKGGRMLQRIVLLLTIAILASCTHSHKGKRTSADDVQKILKSNLEFLASDELEGRGTGKPGIRVAAQYIASQLKQYGVEPFGDNGTYFQNFEMESRRILESSSVSFNTLEQKRKPDFIKNEFIIFQAGSAVKESPLVFVGHGIDDTVTGFNNYSGLDVKGKTVVCLTGSPKTDAEGKAMDGGFARRWRRSNSKAKVALNKGADGVIVLLSPYWTKRMHAFGARYRKESLAEKSNKATTNGMWLDSLQVKTLFKMENEKYATILNKLGEGFLKPGHTFSETVSWDIKLEKKAVAVRNVVGIVKGSDPSLESELVSVGAHYDHLGKVGEKIYNGADDNGSGTVAILESARQIAHSKKNKRSIVFIWYTAEELGLIGSKYFTANHPRIKDFIVNVNMDMVGRETADTMFVVGSGRISSDFFDIVEDANKETANFVFDYTLDDEKHPSRIYYRSDHWSFAKIGIPVVFLTDMHQEDYHKVSDTTEKINFKKIKKVVDITKRIALKVANLEHKLLIDNTGKTGATSN